MRLNFSFYERIVSFFSVGYLPFGPGTWASLSALFIGFIFLSFFSTYFFFWVWIGTLALGTYACFKQLSSRPYLKDPRDYVIDEVVGQWVMMWGIAVFFEHTILLQLVGFVLFRVFDIVKPWPISWANDLDRSPSPLIRAVSIMLDDVLAAGVGFLVLLAGRVFFF